jgi:prephenate dehydrogenase
LGSSVGLALRDAELADERIGYDRDPNRSQGALRKRAIDSVAASLEEAADEADVLIFCVPVQHVVESVLAAGQQARETALLMDVGSTKRTICEQLESSPLAERFVGCHPMAGSERAGPEKARGGLFDEQTVIISPLPSTGSEYLSLARHFWLALGATTVDMAPVEHDEVMAQVSHLPHMLAAALAGSTDPDLLRFTATGWSDTTRIAAGEPELWEQIILENRLPLLQAMENFATIWARWTNVVRSGDSTDVHQLLAAGKQIRDLVANRNSSR